VYSSMVIDLVKRSAAFVSIVMMFIPHIVAVICSSLFYSIFSVPYMAVLVFSLKGTAYEQMGTDLQLCMQVDHKQTWI